MKMHYSLAALMTLSVICGCSQPVSQPAPPNNKPPANVKNGGGDEKQDEGDVHDGEEKHDVGTQEIGSVTVSVAVIGDIVAGKEAVLDVKLDVEDVQAVRAWIGVESGTGSLKSKLEGNFGHYHAHLETPSELPNGSAIWIEVEDKEGQSDYRAFTIP